MATIAFGLVGAAIGSTYGPGGWKTGWAIGTTIGGVIEQVNRPSVKLENGKLADLRYSGSSYGTPIPKIWGTNIVAGNIIWTANYIDNKDLVPTGTADSKTYIEHKKTTSSGGGGSGGGGGSSSTEYWYSGSYCVCFGEASTFRPDGTFVTYNPVILRIYANDIKIYDADDPDNNKITIRFRYGAESQTVDSLIESAEGIGNASANRGLITVVIEDHDLKPYGNQFPNIRAEIATDVVTLENILTDVVSLTGLPDDYVDFSSANTVIDGYTNSQRGSAQSIIDPLLSIFAYDLSEIDGILKTVSRGRAVDVSIPETDLNISEDGNGFETQVKKTRIVRDELPGRIDFTYYDSAKNFQQSVQSEIKSSGDILNPQQISVPVTMTADDARKVATRLLDTAYVEQTPYEFKLGFKYRYLCPTDVVNLSYTQNEVSYTKRLRITEIQETPFGTIRVTALPDDIDLINQSIPGGGGSGGGGGTSSVPVPCDFYAWSGKELREPDRDYSGFYVGATWASNGYGGSLYYSTDGGTTYIYGGYIGYRTIFGDANSILSDGSGPGDWDLINDFDITITDDGISELENTTEDGVLNGENICLLGDELLGVVTFTPTGAYDYTASHLRRGLKEFPYTGHVASEKFVLVSNALLRVNVSEDFVGENVYVKVVAPGQELSDVTAQIIVIQARNPSDIESQVDYLRSAKPANTFYAGPTSGADAVPDFRLIVLADIPDNLLTNAKLATVSTATFKGRTTAGTGNVEDLTATQATALLNVFVGDSGAGGTKGLVPAPASGDAAAGKFLKADGTWAAGGGGYTDEQAQDAVGLILLDSARIDFTYDDATPTISADIIDNSISYAKVQQASAGYTIIAKVGTGAGNYAELAAGTDSVLMRSGSGDIVFSTIVTNQIGALQVTYAKIQNVSATNRILGRISSGSGVIEELTGTQTTSLLDVFVGDSGSGGTKGLVPAPSAGDSGKFLKGNATWATVSVSPAGSTKEIQYNNAGAFGASSTFVWDFTNLRLGVGTASPGYKCVITESNNANTCQIVNSHASFTGTVLKIGTVRTSNSGYYPLIVAYGTDSVGDSGTTMFSIRGDGWVNIGASTINDPIVIDSSINSNAAGKPTIVLQGAANKERIEIRSFNASSGSVAPSFQGVGASGTVASPGATATGTFLGIFGGGGYDNAGTPALTGLKAFMSIISTQAWTTTAQGCCFTWQTTADSTTSRTEKMRLQSTGELVVGTTSALGTIHAHQTALGSAVFALSSAATNDDPTMIIYHNRVTTTNNTVTTLHTINCSAATTHFIIAKVWATQYSSSPPTEPEPYNAAGYIIVATVSCDTTTAAIVGSVSALTTQEDVAGWNATIDVTGSTARVRVTGASGSNIVWHCQVEVYKVAT